MLDPPPLPYKITLMVHIIKLYKMEPNTYMVAITILQFLMVEFICAHIIIHISANTRTISNGKSHQSISVHIQTCATQWHPKKTMKHTPQQPTSIVHVHSHCHFHFVLFSVNYLLFFLFLNCL